eukprot:CAMPEP_0118717292 /NCGR_PEP_ID=MMETSP0800-20121206/28057_1 /TAXON_ID=210618 ORGANISM="Striatella unipunctata, Strain CCMP2910" /NCGR_SAMPLE_ID=MMETSP0800 /ASSEMBLY_ACC=CAM_ASM_000638 /LENGTH=49 /DNA_ID= /DNA_START= /DNA_END= /DNA_ORIENTATION=
MAFKSASLAKAAASALSFCLRPCDNSFQVSFMASNTLGGMLALFGNASA